MEKNRVFKKSKVTRDEVLKVTTLLYFKDALLREQYEDCAELIRIAKGFGAEQGEISSVIAECNSGGGAAWIGEADQVGGRLRFY